MIFCTVYKFKKFTIVRIKKIIIGKCLYLNERKTIKMISVVLITKQTFTSAEFKTLQQKIDFATIQSFRKVLEHELYKHRMANIWLNVRRLLENSVHPERHLVLSIKLSEKFVENSKKREGKSKSERNFRKSEQ